MNLWEAVGIALASLRANRLRSVLTLLGIVIGVMTVITVISFISGLNSFVADEVFNLGADVFVVNRTPPAVINQADWIAARKRKNLYMEDAAAVRELCSECTAVGAQLTAGARVKSGREFIDGTQIRGLTPEIPVILGENLDSGRAITDYDVRHSRFVAVVGTDIVDNLFPFVDPIGKKLRVNGREFEIVGIGEKLGSIVGQSRDNWVQIPITAHQRIWGARRSVRIYAKAKGEENIEVAADQARMILRTRRHVAYNADDDFTIATNDMFLELWANISQAFFAVTVAIASISLVVGGIVVMNIMLVSVTERTREIGIRKATGARRADIMLQFLVESATLSLVGGVIGVLLAIVIAKTVSAVTALPSSIEWWAVLMGLTVSTTVGLFFGIWPAKKAANLDPITALRYE
jgi:putative ABC transport system permease protein